MKELYKQIIVSNQHRLLELPLVKRLKPIDWVPTRITTLVGSRRAGKTYHLFQYIQDLVQTQGVEKEQILYINMEDDRLFPFDYSQFDSILQAFYELFPENKQRLCYFFFDEIQEIPHWEKFIRRVHDTERAQIVLTGSSSTLLSKELATALRGRTITHEVFPFSFSEYLIAKKGSIGSLYEAENQAFLKNLFQLYLITGGFPEAVSLGEDKKRQLWQDYIDLIIYRDLIERHRITNTYLIKLFLKFLLVNQGNLLSINKIYNDFKSQGLAVSKSTLFDYLSYAEDAYVLFSVKKWSPNLREQQRNPIKIYIVDIGLKRVMTNSLDSGRALENLVFLQLRRMFKDIYYWKGNQELDFCVPFKDGFRLINVSDSLFDHATKEREIKALDEAMKYFGEKKSYLLTVDDEYEIDSKNGRIHVIPVWKWCLQESMITF